MPDDGEFVDVFQIDTTGAAIEMLSWGKTLIPLQFSLLNRDGSVVGEALGENYSDPEFYDEIRDGNEGLPECAAEEFGIVIVRRRPE